MSLFSPRQLLETLEQLPSACRYWVAYSGGMDSHVLLHALSQLRDELAVEVTAIHIHHGLSPDAAAWVQHCESICGSLDISLQSICVDATAVNGESPEAAARHARYQAFAGIIEKDDILLTAHHQNDQAETVLLQLLRGAGPHGLAAMPMVAEFNTGYHARPLLNVMRKDLHAYARQAGLQWVEDPSNFDISFSRNFLRQKILPLMEEHWPAATRTISRSAAHNAEAAGILDKLAATDLKILTGVREGLLAISGLCELEPARQRNVLRYWFKTLDLPLPNTRHLERIQQDILKAGQDREPLVCWAGAEVRRYRDYLYAMLPRPHHNADLVLPWDLTQALKLPGIAGELKGISATGCGLNAEHCQQLPVSVRFRQGGEQCRVAGRRHTHSLKNLLQQQGIPPWERDSLPLIYLGDELAAIADLWVCEAFQCRPTERGILIEWRQQGSLGYSNIS